MRQNTCARGIALLVALLIAPACSDGPTEPGSALSIHFVVGGSGTDTVLALATPVTIEIRQNRRDPVQGVLLDVVALPPAGSSDSEPGRGAYVCSMSFPACAVIADGGYSVIVGVSDTTNADGRLQLRVQHGVILGQARIRVTIHGTNITRTLVYNTQVGALARVFAGVADTAIYVGASYVVGATPADRYGNLRPEYVTFTSLTPSVVSVTPGGQVTAVGIGRGKLLMTAGTASDTAFVSVPPPGRLAVYGTDPASALTGRIVLMNTDGAARRVAASFPVNGEQGWPNWVPGGGGQLTLEQAVGPISRMLFVGDTLGGPRTQLVSAVTYSLATQATFSLAEAKLYFFGIAGGVGAIYRADANGSNASPIVVGVQPAPSPDGSRLAFVLGDSLLVRDMVTEDVIAIARDPVLPRWSPVGDLIAYVKETLTPSIRLIHPDGTGARTLIDGNFDTDVAWSPDGQWIAAFRTNGGLRLIRVSNGEELPIPRTAGHRHPAWRP